MWYNDNYLRLAIIVICNATIIPIDAIIGNNNELSWDDASLIESTDMEIEPVLESISEASSQLNSLLFPIIASIGLIVALQITIIARRK